SSAGRKGARRAVLKLPVPRHRACPGRLRGRQGQGHPLVPGVERGQGGSGDVRGSGGGRGDEGGEVSRRGASSGNGGMPSERGGRKGRPLPVLPLLMRASRP